MLFLILKSFNEILKLEIIGLFFYHQSENRTIQKKSYRILEEICSGITSISNELLSTNLSVISDTLLQSLSRSSPSSKAVSI